MGSDRVHLERPGAARIEVGGTALRSIAIANQKGGVGKTTTAIHLAHGLAMAGQRVAQIDLDPQGNSTLAVQGMHIDPGEAPSDGIFAALEPLRDGLWILPSPGAEANVARHRIPDVDRLVMLTRELESSGFDWLIVDCPPRMDDWGLAGIRICKHVLMPVQAEFFAIHGLSQMIATLDRTREEFPTCGELLGVVVTMFDGAAEIGREILEDLRRNMGDQLLESVICRDMRFVEAASHGLTLFDYNLGSAGARSYGELVREISYGRA